MIREFIKEAKNITKAKYIKSMEELLALTSTPDERNKQIDNLIKESKSELAMFNEIKNLEAKSVDAIKNIIQREAEKQTNAALLSMFVEMSTDEAILEAFSTESVEAVIKVMENIDAATLLEEMR